MQGVQDDSHGFIYEGEPDSAYVSSAGSSYPPSSKLDGRPISSTLIIPNMSLKAISTRHALTSYNSWALSQPNITYESVEYGPDHFHLIIRSCYENDTVCDLISLEAYDNATKRLDELDLQENTCF